MFYYLCIRTDTQAIMVAQTSPFSFGRTVAGHYFTDREKETTHLLDNFNNNINTVLISPRRWGKTSLVKRAGDQINLQDNLIVYIDAFPLKTEEEFYNTFTSAIIKATSSKWEEWIKYARQFLSHLSPKISFGTDPVNEFEISFTLEDISKNYRDILNLPEQYALKHHKHMIICIDEFQAISAFNNPLQFQKCLRSVWQHQQHVCYCLYGSKQHMMQQLFDRQSAPFYRFGDVIYLQKIAMPDWIPFITERFASTGKIIHRIQAERIVQSVSCHPYYIQQLCHQVWAMTIGEVNDEVILLALNEILEQNALLYQRDTEELSGYQLNFLKAIANGLKSRFTTKENLKKFDLGTSANVSRIKETLVKKELIDLAPGQVNFLDPVYELWFKKEILNQKLISD